MKAQTYKMAPSERAYTMSRLQQLSQADAMYRECDRILAWKGSAPIDGAGWGRVSESLSLIEAALREDLVSGGALSARACPSCGCAARRVRKTRKYRCVFCGFTGKWPRGCATLIELQRSAQTLRETVEQFRDDWSYDG